MGNLKEVIGNNLAELRKAKKLTQLEVAEKFNYSDKSISKWEKGDALPDIEVLQNLAQFYQVSVDYLLSPNVIKKVSQDSKKDSNNKITIALLSVSLVWIIATLFYVYLKIICEVNYWMFFTWAVPFSCVVLIVFNAIWGKRKFSFWLTSILSWTIITGVYLQMMDYSVWPIFLLGVPMQIAIILWSQLKPKRVKNKK